jgi:hypothetical protein
MENSVNREGRSPRLVARRANLSFRFQKFAISCLVGYTEISANPF